MKRREFISLLGGAAAASSFLWPPATHSQQAAMPVVGYLANASPAGFAQLVAAFRHGLSEMGYVEGQSVVIEYRWAEGQHDRLAGFAADLVDRRVAVIVATGGGAPALAAKAATATIPIVFTGGTDPVKAGLVDSLARPGGNATGVLNISTVLTAKRLDILRELMPAAALIAVLRNPASPDAEGQLQEIREAARVTGQPIHVVNASARAAKEATTNIPVVMAAIGEPLGVGVVTSLARPGGNVTGFSAFTTELSGKRVEILSEAFPSISRVGFLNNMSNPISPPQWEMTKTAARSLGIEAELLDVRTEDDVRRAFDAVVRLKLGALLVAVDAVTQAYGQLIVDHAARIKIPVLYASREFVDAGGLMTYSVNYPHLYYRAAGVVDKIFKGARPSDLPVEQPTKLELVVNLKAAKGIGLTIPETFLARADEVIE